MKTLSIMNPENREFERRVLEEIAKKHNLSKDFVVTGTKLLDENNQRLIFGTFTKAIPLSIFFIVPIWGAAYLIVPEIFQSQSDSLTKSFGYLLLISVSLWFVWFVFNERMPRVNRGSFYEEVEFAEKKLQPMIDAFHSGNPEVLTYRPPTNE
jgi:hypothetical protein